MKVGRHYTKSPGVGLSWVLNVVTEFDVKALRGFRGNRCDTIALCFNRPGSQKKSVRTEQKEICAHFMQQTCQQCGSIFKFPKTKRIRPFVDSVLLNFLEGEHLRRLSAQQA